MAHKAEHGVDLDAGARIHVGGFNLSPMLRQLTTEHEVACHFAEEVDGSTEQLQATGRSATKAGCCCASRSRS